jgi:hypothetical protein
MTKEASMEECLEGWYTDPFGRHEARWISSGRPTLLVRDGDVESHADPPDEAPSLVPERIVPVGSPDSTRRADDAQHEYWDLQRAVDAAETTVDVGWRIGFMGIKPIWRSAKRRPHGAGHEPV